MWRGVVEITDKVAKDEEVGKVMGPHMSGLES